jgi:hypothetical protein
MRLQPGRAQHAVDIISANHLAARRRRCSRHTLGQKTHQPQQ